VGLLVEDRNEHAHVDAKSEIGPHASRLEAHPDRNGGKRGERFGMGRCLPMDHQMTR
jgi:hypothetical protein